MVIDLSNKNHFDISLHVPISPWSLMLALWDTIEAVWPQKSVTFVEEFPREKVSGPTIAWSIYRRVPGREGLEINKPRARGYTVDPNDPTILYDQYAQWMTIIYQFDIYHISNPDVNKLTEEFDEFLYFIAPTLKNLGVSEWLFDEQTKDEEIKIQNTQDIFKRTIRVRCILERKFTQPIPLIQQIWLQVGTPGGDIEFNERIVRGNNSAKDQLSKKWICNIYAITNNFIQDVRTTVPTGTTYLENVDFRLCVNIPTGKSEIEWLPSGKHPIYPATYYVYYSHIEMNRPTSIGF